MPSPGKLAERSLSDLRLPNRKVLARFRLERARVRASDCRTDLNLPLNAPRANPAAACHIAVRRRQTPGGELEFLRKAAPVLGEVGTERLVEHGGMTGKRVKILAHDVLAARTRSRSEQARLSGPSWPVP